MSLYPRILATAFFSLTCSQLLANTALVSMPKSKVTANYQIAASYQILGAATITSGAREDNIDEMGIFGNIFGFPERGASASILIDDSPFPYLSVTATTHAANVLDGHTSGYSNAEARMLYYFRIVGPNGQVPVTINAHAEVSCIESAFGTCAATKYGYGSVDGFSFSAYANASLTIGGLGKLIDITAYPSVGAGTGGRDSISIKQANLNQAFIFRTNMDYAIQLEATAIGSTHLYGNGGDTFSEALIDPTFSLAPGIANPELYSFAFSEGIGNTPAVPEPSIALFSLTGLGVIALARRRHQQRNSA